MFLDLGLTPREVSRATRMSLAAIVMGLKQIDGTGRVVGAKDTRETYCDPQSTEADHRIANSIQFAASMLRHESRQVTSAEDACTVLTDAANRLSAIARMHRQLTQAPPERNVNLARYLEPFREDIAQSIAVFLKVNATDVTLRAETAVQICLLLNELAMNAVKHGGPPEDGPVILTLDAVPEGEKGLHLTARDNGPGLPKDFSFEKASGIGMSIITSTLEKMGGDIRTLNGPGAGFEITLPLDNERTSFAG